MPHENGTNRDRKELILLPPDGAVELCSVRNRFELFSSSSSLEEDEEDSRDDSSFSLPRFFPTPLWGHDSLSLDLLFSSPPPSPVLSSVMAAKELERLAASCLSTRLGVLGSWLVTRTDPLAEELGAEGEDELKEELP